MDILGEVLPYIYPLIWIISFSMIIYGTWKNGPVFKKVLFGEKKYFYILILFIAFFVCFRAYFGGTMHCYSDGFRNIYQGKKFLETGKFVNCHYTSEAVRYCHFPRLGHNAMAFFEAFTIPFFQQPQSGWYLNITFSVLFLILIFVLSELWLNDRLAALSSAILTLTFPLFFYFSFDLRETIPTVFFVLLAFLGLELYRRYENTSSLLFFTGSAVFSVIIRKNLVFLIPFYILAFLYLSEFKLKNVKKLIPFTILSFLQPLAMRTGSQAQSILSEFSISCVLSNVFKFFNLFGFLDFSNHVIPFLYLIFSVIGFYYLHKRELKISNLLILFSLFVVFPLLCLCNPDLGLDFPPILTGGNIRYFMPSFFVLFVLSGAFIAFVNNKEEFGILRGEYKKIFIFIIVIVTASFNLSIINAQLEPGEYYNSRKRVGAFKCINFLETQVKNPENCYILTNEYGPILIEANSPFQEAVFLNQLSESGFRKLFREEKCVLYWRGLRDYYWNETRKPDEEPFSKLEKNISIKKEKIISKSYPGYNCTLYSVSLN